MDGRPLTLSVVVIVGLALVVGLARDLVLAQALAQLVQQPQLHADEGLTTFLGQFAPGFGSGQHVAHAALRQTEHLSEGGNWFSSGETPAEGAVVPVTGCRQLVLIVIRTQQHSGFGEIEIWKLNVITEKHLSVFILNVKIYSVVSLYKIVSEAAVGRESAETQEIHTNTRTYRELMNTNIYI